MLRESSWFRHDCRVSTVAGALFATLLTACDCGGGGGRPPAGDGGGSRVDSGPCVDGAISCVGRERFVCVDGTPVSQELCERACSPNIGCTECLPGTLYCSGQEVRRCGDDGTTWEVERECPGFEACSNGACVDACALAASERSNVGCIYYAVDLDNEYTTPNLPGISSTPPAQQQFAVVLANPSDVTVQANVFRSDGQPNSPAQTLQTTQLIPPQGLIRIDLPAREVDGSTPTVEGPGTHISNQAYRIETNFPVVAYQFNPIIESASNDASLLIPVPALDTHYRIINWPTANPVDVFGNTAGIPDHSYVTIVGTEPGTRVTVRLGGPTVAGTIQGGGTVEAGRTGDTLEFTIGPFDVINLESTGLEPGAGLGSTLRDLTGTLVTSTAPVAVFSGGERAIAPRERTAPAHPSGAPERWCCTEHIEEQVFPTTSWGRDFVITRSPVRSNHATWREPDILRVLADKNGTTITTNLPAPNDSFTLNENEWREFYADRSFVMTASQPVSVMQMLVSQEWVVSWKSGHGGDPSMILFPPYQQYRDNYIFLAPETFSTNYVVIAAPTGTTVYLDGRDVEIDEFTRICTYEDAGLIEGRPYTAVTCPISGGVHRVDSSQPVGVMVYGYHNVGSYGYAGGSNLTQINPLI